MALCGPLLVARFLFFFISGGRGIGMENNTKAYFFLSYFGITSILTRVIKQENPYSQVDFCKFKPVFFSMMLSSCGACHLNLTFSFCFFGSFTSFFPFSLFRNIQLKHFFFHLSGNYSVCINVMFKFIQPKNTNC